MVSNDVDRILLNGPQVCQARLRFFDGACRLASAYTEAHECPTKAVVGSGTVVRSRFPGAECAEVGDRSVYAAHERQPGHRSANGVDVYRPNIKEAGALGSAAHF